MGAARAQQLSDVEVEVEWLNTYQKFYIITESEIGSRIRDRWNEGYGDKGAQYTYH